MPDDHTRKDPMYASRAEDDPLPNLDDDEVTTPADPGAEQAREAAELQQAAERRGRDEG